MMSFEDFTFMSRFLLVKADDIHLITFSSIMSLSSWWSSVILLERVSSKNWSSGPAIYAFFIISVSDLWNSIKNLVSLISF